MKPGCCVDKSCTPETCMKLPWNRTCGDCLNYDRCFSLFYCSPGRTTCDWFPRRFKAWPGKGPDGCVRDAVKFG